MHILLANPGYKPAWRMGGIVVIVSSVAEALVRRGHRVAVMTTNSNLDEDLDVPLDEPVDVEGVEVWYFRRNEAVKRWLPFVPYLSKSIGYFFAPEMSRTLARVMPLVDVAHIHSPFSYPNYAVANAAFRHGKPLVYQQNGIFDPERLRFRSLKKWLYIQAVERPIMRQAAALIAGTDAERASYEALGVRTECHRIVNGVDVSRYRMRPRPAADARWGFEPGDEVVLFMGRLHPVKGVEKLVRAFLTIHERFPSARLVVAGPDEWGLEERLRAEVLAAGLERHVLFPGMLTGEEKLDLLARADLFCLPSEAEGFSLAILEALASATAVMISPGCHFPEVEAAGVGRIVVPDPESLAEGLMGLLVDRRRLHAMGEKGRAFAEREYSWEHVTSELLSLYERVCSNPALNVGERRASP